MDADMNADYMPKPWVKRSVLYTKEYFQELEKEASVSH
jgi:hypothetical protein